jgi:hypothetical protein
MNQNKATPHTCTLRGATNLIISKTTKAFYHTRINAYRNKNTSK